MTKKPILVLPLVVAALAFALPATAGAAAGTIQGTRAPVGTKVNLTYQNLTLTMSTYGTMRCDSRTATKSMSGEITNNDGTTLEAVAQVADPYNFLCQQVSTGATVSVPEFKITKIFANGPGSVWGATKAGSIWFTMTWSLHPFNGCHFYGNNVPFSYVSGTYVMSFKEATGITSDCGTTKMDGEFAWEKADASSKIILD